MVRYTRKAFCTSGTEYSLVFWYKHNNHSSMAWFLYFPHSAWLLSQEGILLMMKANGGQWQTRGNHNRLEDEIHTTHNIESWIPIPSSLLHLLCDSWRFIQPKIWFLWVDETGCWEMRTVNSSWPRQHPQIDKLNCCLQRALQQLCFHSQLSHSRKSLMKLWGMSPLNFCLFLEALHSSPYVFVRNTYLGLDY